jgi:hypothetical protein
MEGAIMRHIFKNDSTMRFSFRSEDMLVWFRFTNIFSKESLSIQDMWKLKDGDYATLTNRWEDIPSWFELHPLETKDLFVYRMMKKLDDGFEPDSIMDGPNILRVNAGDTIVWFGKSRSDIKSENGVLGVIKMYSNALMLGEASSVKSVMDALRFGSVEECSQDEIKQVHSVLNKLREEGFPRTYSTSWKLG